MDMENVNLNSDQAKAWEEKVNSEIEAVRALLSEVRTAVTTPAGDDDTIMQGIATLGNTLDQVWTKMCNAFGEVQNIVVDVLSKLTNAGNEARENVDNLNSRISR